MKAFISAIFFFAFCFMAHANTVIVIGPGGFGEIAAAVHFHHPSASQVVVVDSVKSIGVQRCSLEELIRFELSSIPFEDVVYVEQEMKVEGVFPDFSPGYAGHQSRTYNGERAYLVKH
jgi:hypothetical protein